MEKNKVKVIFTSEKIAEHGLVYATPGSAAFDLRANIEKPLTIAPGESKLVGTGMKVWLENPNLAGMILPRSGLGNKHGIVLGNLVGLIDSDYQGELMISLWNRGQKEYEVQPYERVAQYCATPIIQLEAEVVNEFTASERGEGGFGSSGRQ